MDKLVAMGRLANALELSSGRRRLRQRQSLLALAVSVLGGCLLPGCSVFSEEAAAEPAVVLHYHSADPGQVQSTLRFAHTRQRMSAITHTADGSCLTEEVQLDNIGRVLGGKTLLAAADSSKSREVVFDPAHGVVEVTTPTFHTYWRVPHDLPWAWTSLLSALDNGAPVPTPLTAMVAQRAAAADVAVRWLDISAFQSHSIMVDQLLVPEDGSATVVLGDDWAELTDGVPSLMHLEGLDTVLEGDDPELLSATLAACECEGHTTLGPSGA